MANDATSGWVTESCALPTVEQPLRIAEFHRLFADAVLRWTRISPTRLDLVLAAGAEPRARDLAAREVACCSFFNFDFFVAGPDVVMSVVVPQTRTGVLDALTDRVDTATASWTKS